MLARDWRWRSLRTSEKLILWYPFIELLDESIWIEVHTDRIGGKGPPRMYAFASSAVAKQST